MKLIRFSIIALAITGFLFTGCKKESNPPTPIVVSAGPSQSIQLPADSATLTGTVTSGQSPTLVYSWTFIVGPNTPTILNGNSTVATVKGLIAGTYIFQFSATNSTGTVIGEDTVSVSVTTRNPIIKTITIQPGAVTGQDIQVDSIPGTPNGGGNFNMSGDNVLRSMDWTFYAEGAGEGKYRSFVKFTALDTLPVGAVITNATLSLTETTPQEYSTFTGDSYYPGSQYNSSNPVWLQRCTQSWDRSTITFNNQPRVTTVDEVAIPASTSAFNYNITNLDVTQLIKDMKATPGTNFGFCMRLQTEAIYRSMWFDASNSQPDSSTGPKLIVTYQY